MSNPFNYRQGRPTPVSPYSEARRVPRWRRAIGCVFLLLALGLLAASAGLVLIAPTPAEGGDAGIVAATEADDVADPTSTVEAQATADEIVDRTPASTPANTIEELLPEVMPTLSSARIAELLATPPEPIDARQLLQNTGLSYDPFTIVPNRSRSRMLTYAVVRGDTIDAIANRFGISRETIAWCNSPRKAQILLPGDTLNVPPGDGACHTVLASQGKDIRAIANQYDLDDPYDIIDASANELPDISPETQLPSGKRLFIPGGVGTIITWNAPVEEDSAGNVIAFARGHPNSCGAVAGGGTFWSNPLPNGTYVRGFYAGHSGIDISAPTGTAILAANGGPVLYAGWNSWGYGYTVVIGHGPFSTLYGHMSRLAVRCGNFVVAGQVIGYVGSTGNSSGPHLHFEIRYRNQPQDPSQTLGVGW